MTALNGQTITYDALGNPTNYLGHTLRWNRVRQLEYFDNTWFDYDIFGKRTRKSSIFYGYEGDRLIRELRDDVRLIYFHDATGFIGFKCTPRNSTTGEKLYYYKKNLQGDVVGIYDEDGIEVASYAYDAWGKCTILSETDGIGTLNPIRYRSYYYDVETGLYYLNSRYYDPNIGRFINADVYVSTGQGILGNNMFAYCANNPVNMIDPSGMLFGKIGGFLKRTLNGTKNFLGKIFGASASYSKTKTLYEYDKWIIPFLLSRTTGAEHTSTITESGDSSKPISVYASSDASNPFFSASAGLKINIVDFSIDASLGLDNIGISFSYSANNKTDSIGVTLNLSEFRAGFQGSNCVQFQEFSETVYSGVNIDLSTVLMALAFIMTGQSMSVLQPAYN